MVHGFGEDLEMDNPTIVTHHVEPRITMECPDNDLGVWVNLGPLTMALHFDNVEEWWHFRSGIKRHENYSVWKEDGGQLKGEAAQEYCRAFYAQSLWPVVA